MKQVQQSSAFMNIQLAEIDMPRMELARHAPHARTQKSSGSEEMHAVQEIGQDERVLES